MFAFVAVLATLASLVLVTVGIVLRLSKLTTFENPSFSFRLQYAVYTSPLGQWIHNYFLRSHQESSASRPHTELCHKFEDFETFSVHYLPFLDDNYAYFLIDHATGETAVVDPADPDLVLETFNSLMRQPPCDHELRLTTILCTHKHMDHAGGNTKLRQLFPRIKIVSGTVERVSAQNTFLSHQDSLQLGATSVQLLDTPCHTVGHVVFFVFSHPDHASTAPSPSASVTASTTASKTALFSGDILFVGGCGRFFEGNGTVMLATLQLLKSLPASTALFCGHEYTVNNLAFCLLVEPSNEQAQRKHQWAKQQRQLSRPTIPSTLREELECNVFLRYDQKTVMEAIDRRVDQRALEDQQRGGEKKAEKRGAETAADERKVMIAKSSHVLVLEELRLWRNQEA
jgi:hydroxyacylglutathione hydrolase